MTDTADQIKRLHGVDEVWAPIDPVKERGYGEIGFMVEHLTSGRVVTVIHADDVIGVSKELLDMGGVEINPDGHFVADTAGEYVYRPVRFTRQGKTD